VLNPRKSLEAWVTKYEGLTLYVVNGAGHMVPSDKPNTALKMFESFIKGKI
jgi:carboxypeptidase C (cathepsin A)